MSNCGTVGFLNGGMALNGNDDRVSVANRSRTVELILACC